MTKKKNKRSKHRCIYDAALRKNALSKSKAVSFMKRKQLDGFGRKINASEKTYVRKNIHIKKAEFTNYTQIFINQIYAVCSTQMSDRWTGLPGTGILTSRYKSRWQTPVIAYLRFRT